MKADLAIYIHVLGVPGQYESVALMLSHKMNFNCCANRDSFRTDSHICCDWLWENSRVTHKNNYLGKSN